MAEIFISYRREDSGGHAGRLCDRLTARFGNSRVFMDLQDIAPGQNFAQSIDETIAKCDCVVAVIGPRWLESIKNRAAAPEDYVEHEIAAALRRNVTVIPVLVGGARVPDGEQLPASLSALRYRNAIEVRDERFDDDVARLSDSISALGVAVDSGPASSRRRSAVARLGWPFLAACGVMAAVAAYLTFGRTDGAGPATVGSAVTGGSQRPPAIAASMLDGDWIAEVQKEGQPVFRIRLTFAVVGDGISGVVRYPTGDGAILDAHLTDRTLTFHTSHVPQFESTPAIIRYQAEVDRDEIRFVTTDNSGIARGIAKRAPSRRGI